MELKLILKKLKKHNKILLIKHLANSFLSIVLLRIISSRKLTGNNFEMPFFIYTRPLEASEITNTQKNIVIIYGYDINYIS